MTMNKTYVLNTLLSAVLGVFLLACVVVRAFVPAIILPELDVPMLVLLSLVALVLEHYMVGDAKRCYICIPLFGALAFGLLPFAACFAGAAEALKLALVGGLTFTVTTWLFTTIQERLSSGPAAKASAFFSAVSLYMAAQCFMGILL
jgi:hypothetical protein